MFTSHYTVWSQVYRVGLYCNFNGHQKITDKAVVVGLDFAATKITITTVQTSKKLHGFF